MSNELKETLAEMRALDGDLTGCVPTLQSSKLMPASSSPEVAGEWRTKVSVEKGGILRDRVKRWQEPVVLNPMIRALLSASARSM